MCHSTPIYVVPSPNRQDRQSSRLAGSGLAHIHANYVPPPFLSRTARDSRSSSPEIEISYEPIRDFVISSCLVNGRRGAMQFASA